MIIWYIVTPRSQDCVARKEYTGVVSGLLIFYVFSATAEVFIILVGLRGTMFERSKRTRLPAFVYCDVFAHLGQAGVNGARPI